MLDLEDRSKSGEGNLLSVTLECLPRKCGSRGSCVLDDLEGDDPTGLRMI